MTSRRLLLIVLPVLVLLPAPPARSDEAPPSVAVPTGIPIQLDGAPAKAEWADAATLSIGDGTAQLRVKQFRGTLLLAFEAGDAWIEGDELMLSFVPEPVETDHGAWSAGAVSIRYEPLKHDRSHLIVNRMEGMSVAPHDDQVVARSRLAPYACRVELAVALTFLGLERGKEAPLRFQCIRARPGAGAPIPTWPVGLEVGARPNDHPPDRKTSERWGRLTGLAKAGGPGAISKRVWTTLLEEQAEIARRGLEAHALMREMQEERKSFLKQDTLVDEQIFGNLRWIAAREPLGDVDRLLLAKAHRMVNRHDEGLAVIDVLLGSRRPATATRALYERARTLHEMERFTDEAETWDALAARTSFAMTKRQYEGQAQRAREMQEALAAEAALRKQDATRADTPLVEIRTNRGTFVIQLFPDETPKAVAHFLSMVKEGFYDGLRFHRALAGFMVQSGDPTTREGDCSLAGKEEGPRRVDVEQSKRRKPWRGAVCFARKQGLYSNGSHFFVMTGPRPELVDDSRVPYTLFGRVVAGMDAVDRLEWCDTLEQARVLVEPPTKSPPPKAPPEDGADDETEDK